MRTEDRLQDTEIKIIRALYENGKETDGKLSYHQKSFDLHDILNHIGVSESTAKPALENLRKFDFIEWDKDSIKLLPSGI